MYLHPALAQGRSALRALIARAKLPPGTPLIVAVSGGSDSMALAHIARFVANKDGYRIVCVTVDHGVREGSANEAALVARWLRDEGIEDVRTIRVQIDKDGGPEAGARNARYSTLESVAIETGGVVLLGHTQDDQAETLLLGLSRGSGPRSLAGMAPLAQLPTSTRDTLALRPLLHIRRRDLRAALRSENVAWVDDPTNEPDGEWRAKDGKPLTRNAIRHTALPALREAVGDGVTRALADTADLLRRDNDALDMIAGQELERMKNEGSYVETTDTEKVARVGETVIVVQRESLLRLHPALSTRILRLCALKCGARAGELSRTHIDSMEKITRGQHGHRYADIPGAQCERRGKLIVLSGVKKSPENATH